jgi:hypothetical protein
LQHYQEYTWLSKIWTKVLLKDASDSSAKKKNIPENSIK